MTIYLNALGIVCALGRGPAAVRAALLAADAPGAVAMTERFRASSTLIPKAGLPMMKSSSRGASPSSPATSPIL